jgi:hypothetical protein
VKLAFKPSKKVDLSLAYHYFSTTSDVTVKGKDLDRGLGSELDLQVDWQIMKDVKLSAGYSTMLGTSTREAVKIVGKTGDGCRSTSTQEYLLPSGNLQVSEMFLSL